MARYIDADSMLEHIAEHRDQCPNAYQLTTYAELLIADEPTVDAAEVVHGEWIWHMGKRAKCSRCGSGLECKSEMMFALLKEAEHYCYNCGAKMDGGK